jgi:hypothetical protein
MESNLSITPWRPPHLTSDCNVASRQMTCYTRRVIRHLILSTCSRCIPVRLTWLSRHHTPSILSDMCVWILQIHFKIACWEYHSIWRACFFDILFVQRSLSIKKWVFAHTHTHTHTHSHKHHSCKHNQSTTSASIFTHQVSLGAVQVGRGLALLHALCLWSVRVWTCAYRVILFRGRGQHYMYVCIHM